MSALDLFAMLNAPLPGNGAGASASGQSEGQADGAFAGLLAMMAPRSDGTGEAATAATTASAGMSLAPFSFNGSNALVPSDEVSADSAESEDGDEDSEASADNADGVVQAGLMAATPTPPPASQTINGRPITETSPAPAPGASPVEPRAEAAPIPVDPVTPDGEAAPEPTRTIDTQSAASVREHLPSTLARAGVETTAMLSAQIVRRLEARSTRFDMVLTPEDLGRVDVRMEVDSDGQLTARLAFDNPAAAAELRGRADELRRQLEASGFQMSDSSLEFAERDGGRRDQPFDQRGRAFAGAGRLADAADPISTPPRWTALSLTPEGVDMKV